MTVVGQPASAFLGWRKKPKVNVETKAIKTKTERVLLKRPFIF